MLELEIGFGPDGLLDRCQDARLIVRRDVLSSQSLLGSCVSAMKSLPSR
jgi:hypothetical protein